MRGLMIGAGLLALAGCGGNAPEPEATADNAAAGNVTLEAGPMLGGVDLSQRVQASGRAPEWLLDIAPGTIYLWDFAASRTEPDQLYFVAPQIRDAAAVYETRNLAGEQAVLTLTAEPCTGAGAAGATLPLTAELVVGARTLRGCAGPAPDLPPGEGDTPAALDNATAADEATPLDTAAAR